MTRHGRRDRALIVLADGVQAAFAAGAAAELARAGVRWRCGYGAGLGAQVAALALLGEAEEAERRWRRQAELGCPLFRSAVGAAAERLAGDAVVVLPDAWNLTGWLDPDVLTEHLEPEMADLPGRLRRARTSCAVAALDLIRGTRAWHELSALSAREAGTVLTAAARFPAGWGGLEGGDGGDRHSRWGGVGAMPLAWTPFDSDTANCDVVCGFPVAACARPALGTSLLELVQRHVEIDAAERVEGWLAGDGSSRLRLLAPAAEAWNEFSQRDTAELGVEYPLPWERNGELTGQLVAFGAFVARRAL